MTACLTPPVAGSPALDQLAHSLTALDRLLALSGRVTVVTYREPVPRVARPLPAALVERVTRAAEVRR